LRFRSSSLPIRHYHCRVIECESAFEIAMKRVGDQQSPFVGALKVNGASLENYGAW
jgi:hypothetical protein